ncbi:MAG: NADH:flavin oxidoreductase [Deltaproteobacteria bacterium]
MSILFAENLINRLHLKNRFVRSATYEAMAKPDGACSDALSRCLTGLARGGVGLIITGYAYVHKSGKASPLQMAIDRDDVVPAMRQLTGQVHKYGGKVALQLSHAGGHTRAQWSLEPLLAPSPFKNLYGETTRELSRLEISEIGDAFVKGGKRAQRAGFDAIQLHAAHGLLFNQFLSPAWNKRSDIYGGSLENRARFLLETCSRLRQSLGRDYPILVKLNSEDFMEKGFTLDEAVWVSERLGDVGVDAIEVSGGSRYSGAKTHIRSNISEAGDEAYFADNARRIKVATRLLVMLVGGIRSFDLAEKLVQAGTADYISMSRPLIREPDLINRWKSGDKSKAKCISDNGCFVEVFRGEPLRCIITEKKPI